MHARTMHRTRNMSSDLHAYRQVLPVAAYSIFLQLL